MKYNFIVHVTGDSSAGIRPEKHVINIDFNDDANPLGHEFYRLLAKSITETLQSHYNNGTKSFVTYGEGYRHE